ncbi:AMP-binding protein [Nocardia sp. alder85J]|uniref:AMP-binding protein n=1 Tax=Nocardia sp. alder85J TaxID=2862949 RepID=UPI001CD37758|nr:AMP-binding protein [Nocardia sp. alder85J]MCX4093242.1 AMP-binding protein [Nocardia sp. alder85J]
MRKIPADLAERYVAAGWWTDDTLGDLLGRGLAAAPDTEFHVHSEVRPWSGTFGEIEQLARRLAAGLRERGVQPGDVIALQLPNWAEAAVGFWAAALLGAVVVPIVHIYGCKEVEFILRTVRARVFLTAESFGPLRYRPEVSAQVPVVGVVGRDFDELLAAEPMTGIAAADPDTPALIAFTSGTTRDPKGVVHSHRTLGFEIRQLGAHNPPYSGPALTAAPVGHFIGMLGGLLLPVLDGTPVHLMDVWNPQRVLALMSSHGVAIKGGVPYYITSLLDHADFRDEHLSYIRYLGFGGAPVPSAVTTRLTELGITVFRSYGSTEHPSVTGSHYTAAVAKRLATDGAALPGVEVRLAEDGEIITRGPELCLGYTDDALTARAFDDDGWYHTGDIGVFDADGYLTITDRKSDLIIRGGENIGALEVEEALLGMSGVAEAAVVAAPDARLGEHAAAVLRLRVGAATPTLDDLRAHLAEVGLAKQKWPEEVHVVDDFPRTPSGKVQRFRLRRAVADGTLGATDPEPTAAAVNSPSPGTNDAATVANSTETGANDPA